MAGDWIKMRMDIGDDPAVVQIAAKLGISEDEVVGKLHRLWSWADRHTTDGTAPAITSKWVDRYVGRTGFAEAMVAAEWLSFSESGVAFPHFDRHNGETAKRRADGALRQRLSRKNRDNHVTGVTRTSIPAPFRRHVIERDASQCVYCGSQNARVMTIDHVIPESRGGVCAVENLVCCCGLCNNEKNDRTPEEWGLLPTFLQPGVSYVEGCIVTNMSQKTSDKTVTREEKKRKEKKDQEQEATPLGAGAPPFGAHQPIVDAYHELLPKCQPIATPAPKRMKRLANAAKLARRVCAANGWTYEPETFWRGYFAVCANDPWMRGDVANPNNARWKQNLDVLLADERLAQVIDQAINSLREAA